MNGRTAEIKFVCGCLVVLDYAVHDGGGNVLTVGNTLFVSSGLFFP